MKKVSDRLVWGLALILLGGLLLVRNLTGSWQGMDELLFGGLFAAAGLGFMATHLARPKERWWAVIPGCTLLGLGALLFLSSLGGNLDDSIGAPVFLAAISLSFLLIFMREPTRWWALIPGGVIASTAATALVEGLHWPVDGGAVMMFGLAATFGLLSLVNTPKGRMRWPLIPAGVLAAIGVLILSESLHLGGMLWPIALVLVGVVFVLRSLAGRPKHEE